MNGRADTEASVVSSLLKALGVSVYDLAGFFPAQLPNIPIIKKTPLTSDEGHAVVYSRRTN